MEWKQIRANALAFAREWKGESRESAEAQSFWNDFFKIFGLNRRRLASFEHAVRDKLTGKAGRIDLFWKGVLLVEHKTAGEDLDAASTQAMDYFGGLTEAELPRWILVSDFERMRLYDLEKDELCEFHVADLVDNVSNFRFILGQEARPVADQEPVNQEAAQKMADLHDALEADGFSGHDLELFLVRLLFCFFADDTGIIMPRDRLHGYLERSKADGSDLSGIIHQVFDVLDKPPSKRQKTLDEDLAALPYVNGGLFDDSGHIPHFNAAQRDVLLACSQYDWSGVNPVIFGALFQSIGHVQERRREQGMHYTSEVNIRKVIDPLFLDDMQRRFEESKHSASDLRSLLKAIKNLTFLDPACGCGNFLVVAYRELRLLELRCYERLSEIGAPIQLSYLTEASTRGIDVDAFYGIEKEEFPSQIARTALWLVDHQMNVLASKIVGETLLRLPLRVSPHIHHGNALTVDWRAIVDEKVLSYILGNPPFIGKKKRDPEQRSDMDLVCGPMPGGGELDYVAAWYVKAAGYIRGTAIRVGFVSTNSIAQGEQVCILWKHLLAHDISIRFAHRSFQWSNEARANANVYVVIIGFAFGPPPRGARLRLFDYESPDAAEYVEITCPHINPYLIDHPDDTMPEDRRVPLCKVPAISNGSMPNDGSRESVKIRKEGNLLMFDQEKEAFLLTEPNAAKYVRPILTTEEWLHGEKRWTLWLRDATAADIRSLPKVAERVERVRQYRLGSERKQTLELAKTPHLFGEIRQPKSRYILVPRHNSEHRPYIPMNFAEPSEILGDSCCAIEGGQLYHLGVLQSDMHMAWIRHVCGRLESRFRYSNTIVYNNFPWPDTDGEHMSRISAATEHLLEVRNALLANGRDTYDTIYETMTPELASAHRRLSREVERAYVGKGSFRSDRGRMEFLLKRYQAMTGTQVTIAEVAQTDGRRGKRK